MNPNETTATNGNPFEELRRKYRLSRRRLDIFLYIPLGLIGVIVGFYFIYRSTPILETTAYGSFFLGSVFLVLGMLCIYIIRESKRFVDNYQWWDNITGSESDLVRQIIDEVLNTAEEDKMLNSEQRKILEHLQKHAEQEKRSGEWPTEAHKKIALRVLRLDLAEAEKLPTTK